MVRKGDVYPCDCPIPVLPPLPNSVTRAYGWAPPSDVRKSYCQPDAGSDCPTYERIAR